jgi:DICT domain-containing protein
MLESVFDEISHTETRFIVYAPTGSDVPSWLETYNVTVEHKPLDGDHPEPFLTIQSDGEFVGSLTLEKLDALLTPPFVEQEANPLVSEGYQVLFEVLNEVVFTALGRRQLLAVSREIEDRAYRFGAGTLRVCFQTFSTFRTQLPVYRQLAADTDLEIHIYAVADWDPPAIDGITYHDISGTDLELYWLLAFEDASEPSNSCGLFAREQTGAFTGYWTDNPALVDRVAAELRATIDDSPGN